MSTSARAGRAAHEEEHENHERWLVSYADMITVLMALFIVLFAISQVDQQKFVELKDGLAEGFGSSSTIPVSGGAGLLTDDGTTPNPTRMDVEAAPAAVDLSGEGAGGKTEEELNADGMSEAQKHAAAVAEAKRLEEIKAQMIAALTANGLGDRVVFRITERGLVAAVVADDVFFRSARADIQPTGLRVLDAVAPTLRNIREPVAVEGHANHLPISSSSIYPTNWELSAARAASVVRHMSGPGGVQATRLSATGFSDTRPLYPRTHPGAIAGNRRVDVVVVSQQPASVRSLLPGIASGQLVEGG